MGFMDFFSNGSSTSTSAHPASKAEKTISNNLAAQSTEALPLFRQLLAQTLGQGGFNDALTQLFQGQLQGLNQSFSPLQQGQMQARQLQELQGLGGTDQNILQQMMAAAGQGATLTPQQQALIQQQADLGIQSGLSDLSKFRDDTLQTIAQNSAARGLRPTDTPIFNQSSQFGQEMQRQAQQLVSGLRQQQAQQMLQYPIAAAQLRSTQLGQAGDMSARRQGFLADLNAQNTQNQMNFGRGITSAGLGIAQGFSGANALGPLVSQRQFTGGTTTSTQTPSGASILGGFLGGL